MIRFSRSSTSALFWRGPLFLLLLLVFAGSAIAATFTVTKTDDTNDGTCDADCSLRESVVAANTLVGADEIVIPAGTYPLSIPGAGEDLSNTGDLDIDDDVTLRGDGPEATIIDANGIDRVIHITSVDTEVDLTQLTITDGHTGTNIPGGGILNAGSLLIRDSTVRNNSTASSGGGVFTDQGASTRIERSTIRDNSARTGAGLWNYEFLTIVDSTISNNVTTQYEGGGIMNQGEQITIKNSTFFGNSASRGDAIFLNTGTSTIINSTLTNTTNSVRALIYKQASASLEIVNSTIVGRAIDNRSGQLILTNTIIEGICTLTGQYITNGGNIESPGDTCGLTDSSDQTNVPDILLAPLSDNGGLTLTHELLAGSPAINTALNDGCPVDDQRGAYRTDGACDVGAFENGVETPVGFVVARIVPNTGGDIGISTVTIYGHGIEEDAGVFLERDGEENIFGASTTVNEGGTAITGSFDLSGKTRGAWHAVVTNPGGESVTLHEPFYIVEGFDPFEDELVAFFPFNGNANDESGNGHNATVSGVPTFTEDRFGHVIAAFDFNSFQGTVTGTDYSHFPLGNDSRTISAWIKTAGVSRDMGVFHYGTQGSSRDFHLYITGGNTVGVGNGWGYGTIAGATLINDNEWHHVVGTYDSETSELSVYVDGALDAQGPISYLPNTGTGGPWEIGRFANSVGLTIQGVIDDLRIHSHALTQADIALLYTEVIPTELRVIPDTGGDIGTVTVTINGAGFVDGAMVRLTRDGEADIVGEAVTVSENGRVITTTFDLTGQARGLRDVVVTNPDGSTSALEDGFTVEEGRAAELWIDIVGSDVMRPGRQQTYWVSYGNKGNVDAWATFLLIQIPANIDYQFGNQDGFEDSNTGGTLAYFVTKIPAEDTQFEPLVLRANNSGDVELKADILNNFTSYGIDGGVELYSIEDLLPSLASSDVQGAMSSISGTDDATSPLLTNPRELGGRGGYVHYFKLTFPNNETENHVGFETPDGRIFWSFPEVGVEITDFIRTGTHHGIFVEHLWGVRPVPDDQMDTIYDQGRVDELLKQGYRFCSRTKYENNCISCVTAVLRALYGTSSCKNPQTQVDGPCPAYKDNFPHDKPVNNWVLLQYLMIENNLRKSQLVEGFEQLNLHENVRNQVITIINSFDPNDKVGSQGAGEEQYLSGEEPLRYSVFFENIETATAPAQEVVITDWLDADLMDLDRISLGPIFFGETIITPPRGLDSYSTDVDLRPDNDLIVRVEANTEREAGILTWRLTALDPDTGELPEDPLAGFLPPNVNPPEGDGSVLLTVMPHEGLPTGTVICNQAEIVFDTNEPIVTPEWCNTLDNDLPESEVSTLAATQTSLDFDVHWSGTDEGSGIGDYTVYVSGDGEPYTPWLTNTPDTTGTFSGENGKTYEFYSVARDLAGNREAAPEVFDATTLVDANEPPVAVCGDVTVAADGQCEGSASVDAGSEDPDGNPITLSQSPPGPYGLGDTGVTLTVTDDSGASDSCTATVTVVDETSPVLTCPGASNASADAQCQAAIPDIVSDVIATDNCTSPLSVTQEPVSGSLVTLGSHVVTASASDGALNQASCTSTFTVSDTTAPEISLSVSPDTLWPPNHKMVPITAIVAAIDGCDPNPGVALKSITMNEGDETNTYDPNYDDTTGDGNTTDDIEVDADGNISLRAERSGTGTGRVYTITYEATDASGNSATAEATVTVPHNQ